MRLFENERGASKRRRKNRAHLQKRKESATIAARRDISPGNIDYPRPTMRRPTILKRNGGEGLRKSLS
jgi:hypothetical protein